MRALALTAAARRLCEAQQHDPLQFMEGLFPEQIAVCRDTSKRIALHPGRRGGKTDLIGKRLLRSATIYPGANEWTGYITLTKGQSRRNMDGPLQELISAYSLPLRVGEVDGQITYTHRNGHRIWLGGVDDLRKAERWRGNKWRELYVDESGAMPDDVLRYLVETILEPALSDTEGLLWIAGTPGVLEQGFFHDITTGKNPDVPKWPTYHWTCLNNPYHTYGKPGGAAKLERYRKSKGWGVDDPTYLREWMGLWCTDANALIYPYEPERNLFGGPQDRLKLPDCDPSDWHWVLGVDVGLDDDTAFVLSCSRSGSPEIWFTHAWGSPNMTQPQVASEIMRTRERLINTGHRAPTVCFDTGGLGKYIANDLKHTYGIYVQKADKWDKAASIRGFRGRLSAGHNKIHRQDASELLQEMNTLPWDDKRHEHHPKYPDHRCDAALYAHRGHAIVERWEKEAIDPRTPEGQDMQGREHKAKLEQRAELMARIRYASDPMERMDLMDKLRDLG